MYVTAIIAAAGKGLRVGGAQPKQLLTIDGRAILDRSVTTFREHGRISEIIVALPADLIRDPPSYLRGADKPLRTVEGGARRQDSVANAFRAAGNRPDVVVVHDAARPFASADLIERTIVAAAEWGAAIAAVRARDTVKAAHERDLLKIRATLPRDTIYLAQTPQAFRRDVLRDALAQNNDATDEAELAERAGHNVRLVEGEMTNIKITTVEDLPIAEAIARARKSVRTGRAGIGYDLHRLVADRPLILGGVTIPSDRGALGHSDADVVCHAVIDAVLGAASLGNIGSHFPDHDPQWKNASSLDLLRRTARIVAEHGFEVGNVDVTVVLESPRIRDHVDAMRASIAVALGVNPSAVSIKGKTNEGMDAVGRGEAVAAHAIALIRSV